MKRSPRPSLALAVGLLGTALLAACASGPSDAAIEEEVRTVLQSAADVPGSQLEVTVENGVVALTGSTECPDCGGQATPGGRATVEQSIGAIIRAVPGVQDVTFLTGSEP